MKNNKGLIVGQGATVKNVNINSYDGKKAEKIGSATPHAIKVLTKACSTDTLDTKTVQVAVMKVEDLHCPVELDSHIVEVDQFDDMHLQDFYELFFVMVVRNLG
jgi:hypothetical protein